MVRRKRADTKEIREVPRACEELLSARSPAHAEPSLRTEAWRMLGFLAVWASNEPSSTSFCDFRKGLMDILAHKLGPCPIGWLYIGEVRAVGLSG